MVCVHATSRDEPDAQYRTHAVVLLRRKLHHSCPPREHETVVRGSLHFDGCVLMLASWHPPVALLKSVSLPARRRRLTSYVRCRYVCRYVCEWYGCNAACLLSLRDVLRRARADRCYELEACRGWFRQGRAWVGAGRGQRARLVRSAHRLAVASSWFLRR